MAINYTTQQSYSKVNPYGGSVLGATTKPVAVGPVPTPIPPKNVVYTPQYSGGQSFPTSYPVSYTSTPQGSAELKAAQSNVQPVSATPTTNQQSVPVENPYGAPAMTTYNIRGTNVTAGTPQEAINQAIPTTDYNQFANIYNPEQFLNQIEGAYGQQSEFYNQQENALKAAQDTFNKTIEADYAANLAKAGESKTATGGMLAKNEILAAQKKQDALNAAKQLYNQLQTGYRQRFGGATSAGEAAQTILGEEQQRQSGAIGRDYTNAISDIATQKVNLEKSYDSAIADLNYQKQRNSQEVVQNFTNQLSQIVNNRAQSYAAKEQAKLQILLDTRNQLATIQQNNDNYIKSLMAQRAQETGQLDQFIASLTGKNTGFAQSAATSVAKIPTTVTSNIGQQNRTVSSNVLPTSPNALETAVGQMYNPQSQNLSFEERMRLGL